MNADSGWLDPFMLRRAAIDGAGAVNVDAEFVLAQAGGDVRVSFGEDVGIDAQCDAGALLQFRGALGEQVEFAFALDVEEQDARAQGEIDFRGGLADAGEDDALGCCFIYGQNALELAAGHDVETCPLAVEELENGQCGVRFYRIADQVLVTREGLCEEAQTMADVVCRVDVEWRSILPDKRVERDIATCERRLPCGINKRANRNQAASEKQGICIEINRGLRVQRSRFAWPLPLVVGWPSGMRAARL